MEDVNEEDVCLNCERQIEDCICDEDDIFEDLKNY